MIEATDNYYINDTYDAGVEATITKGNSNGGFPDGFVAYLDSGKKLDKLIIQSSAEIVNFELLCEHREKIKSLILYCKKVDWQVISKLNRLEYLGIGWKHTKCDLEFSNLNSLETISVTWADCYEGLIVDLAKLKKLKISNFGIEDLEILGEMPNLNFLEFNHSKKIKSLKGIEYFNKLKEFRASVNTQLLDIEDLQSCANLEKLFFNRNNKLTDYSSIGQIQSLKELVLVGSSDTVSWLVDLTSLEHLRMGCKLEDKNLDFLYKMTNLKSISIEDKKGQTVKSKDISAYIDSLS